MRALTITPDNDPTWGRPDIRRYAIARCRIDSVSLGWPLTREIDQARKEYDAGFVELAQGRVKTAEGDYLILYRFPRVRRDDTRSPWFNPRHVQPHQPRRAAQ